MSSVSSKLGEICPGVAPSPGVSAPYVAAKPRARLSTRGVVLLLLLLAALAAAGLYARDWWRVGRFVQTTDDAYTKADLVTIAPRVSGYVSEVLVADNQQVQPGDPLVRIDQDSYRAVLARQSAAFAARQSDIAVAKAQLAQQDAAVAQAQAALDGAIVDANFAAQQQARYRSLIETGAVSAEDMADVKHRTDLAQAKVRADQAALDAERGHVATLRAQIGQTQAQALAASAAVDEANLDLGHTLIRASIAGRVGDRTVTPGQFVQPGTRLLSIVPVAGIYVVANFKETQIGAMRIGQAAEIEVDGLGGKVLHGVVDSFAPGTGAEFALLPPENATGNFTKIVQRVPVRLRLLTDDATKARLVPGLSVAVSINTKDAVTGAQK